MDHEFTDTCECGCRVVVAAPPGPANDKSNIGVAFDQRGLDRHLIALDRDAFFDNTAITLDRNTDHPAVTVLRRAGFARLSYQYPNARAADD